MNSFTLLIITLIKIRGHYSRSWLTRVSLVNSSSWSAYDVALVFSQALQKFEKIQIFANGYVTTPVKLKFRVNDHTVPYPSSAIETTDHFAEWESQGLRVEADEGDTITSWSAPPPEEVKAVKKKGWGISMGTLPPVLRYRFPFNYVGRDPSV